MQSLAIHPALWQLLRFQAIGKVRKFQGSFASPRRKLLSLLAIILAVIWLGNAVAGVLLREAYDPETFQLWISRSLLLYFFWHLIRVTYTRPETALEWTPAEQTLLVGGPFSRRELFTYRLMVILSATLPKAAIVTFVLWPDLPMLASGFCGLLLGLVFLEYLRLLLETLACGMTNRQYFLFRASVFAGLIGVVGYELAQAVSLVQLDGNNHWQFLREWAGVIVGVSQTAIGQFLEAPFRLFGQVIVAQQFSTAFFTNLSGTVTLVASAAYVAIRLDGIFSQKSQEVERNNTLTHAQAEGETASASWPKIFHLGGIGAIAWRQLNYARRHWGSLSVGLGVPALLACLPLLIPGRNSATFITVLAGVVFYSFVLLPAALKLDFRRDFDHLALLKSLPLKPTSVVLGQLATPVLLTWAFQIVLISFAAIVCSVPWELAVGSIGFLLPASIFFTALDNLIFLLYPHRLHQEGFEVFLRSTLTFTGKGLLLAGALFGVLLWLRMAQVFAQSLGQADNFRLIFALGIGGLAGLFALVAVICSSKIYARLDPAEL